MAECAGAASGVAGQSEPDAAQGSVAGHHADGVVSDCGGNVHLLGLVAGGVDAHDGGVGVLGDVDVAGGWLLLDEDGAVQGVVEVVVGGVVDVGGEDVVLASLGGSSLETSPDTVTDLENTVRTVARSRNIDGLEDLGGGSEALAGIDKEQLVVTLQGQPHLSGVDGGRPHAVEHGAAVVAHGERVVGNGLLGGGVQLDLDQAAVGHLGQQDEVGVGHTGELVSLSSDRHDVLRDATALQSVGRVGLGRNAGSAQRQRDDERLEHLGEHLCNLLLEAVDVKMKT